VAPRIFTEYLSGLRWTVVEDPKIRLVTYFTIDEGMRMSLKKSFKEQLKMLRILVLINIVNWFKMGVRNFVWMKIAGPS
jgi:hypothetical protein